MKRSGVLLPWIASLAFALGAQAQPPAGPLASSAAGAAVTAGARASQPLGLDACLALARRDSTRRKAAASASEAAAAREGQARSARYPEVSASLTATRLDQDPDFLFPSSSIAVPAGTMQTPPMTMTLPANAFGPGTPPVNVPLAIPGSTFAIPAQVMTVPAQDVKLMDRNLLAGGLSAFYPLYTGGLVSARIAQARAGVAAARHEQRKTDMELTYDVTRAYYGVVLARQILTLARDTLARMEATLRLTESLYKNGAGRVRKTDYLRNKSMVETIRSLVAQADGQERIARAGLEAAIEWDEATPLDVADSEIAPAAAGAAIDAALGRAAASNPDIARLLDGVAAARAGVEAARSGHLPKVGLFASAKGLANSYDAGVMTSTNKLTFAVGVGVELPIFQGFRVSHAVAEAEAALRTREQQLALLRQGVSLEIRRVCYHLEQADQQRTASHEALLAAAENRGLNERAYQEELVETKDVIEAQLLEAVLAAQYYKTLYDGVEARARLELLAGRAADGR